MDEPDPSKTHVTVGRSTDNFWLWSLESGWDLTHPASPAAKPFQSGLSLECDISNITIDPAKTALLIIDMQNFSLSTSLPNSLATPEIALAEDTIKAFAIPAARKAGIQIIWLNWGLTEKELQALPPSVLRVFEWSENSGSGHGDGTPLSSVSAAERDFSHAGESKRATGLGDDLGKVTLEDGRVVDAGKAAMRDTWNAAVHDKLLPAFLEGHKAPRPDVLVHKNRNSGLWNDDSDLNKYLRQEDIRTLLFTGMNTDQCVMGNLLDAQARGFDTIFLKDGCATNSPEYAKESAEYNCRRPLGFLSSCRALARAVEGMQSMPGESQSKLADRWPYGLLPYDRSTGVWPRERAIFSQRLHGLTLASCLPSLLDSP